MKVGTFAHLRDRLEAARDRQEIERRRLLDAANRCHRSIDTDAGPHLRRVLVVDDSAENRRTLVTAITSIRDLFVDEAGTFAEAAQLLADNEYDILVLDIILPNGDGHELIGLARGPGGKAPRVVLISGAIPSELTAYLAEKFGADLALTKPARLSEFVAVMHLFLGP